MPPIKLMTLAPGHFHAALVQKLRLPGVDPTVHVYAPFDADLVAHLERLAAFNARAENLTDWAVEVHAGPDFLERMLRELPGNVVVIAGKNSAKIDYLEACVGAGLHVLADKPWIIRRADLPRLEAVLRTAREREVIVHDIMTERHEVATALMRELVNDRDIFGTITTVDPGPLAVTMESVHYLKKQVAGSPLRRPTWFFDVDQQGEGLADVGTHLVDLVNWVLFQSPPLDPDKKMEFRYAWRGPTTVSRDLFREITGTADFPDRLRPCVSTDGLHYDCNNEIGYYARGALVRLTVRWEVETPPGGFDWRSAMFVGTRAAVELHQSPIEGPELIVGAIRRDEVAAVAVALRKRVAALQECYPGVAITDLGMYFQITIPQALRIDHEGTFARVVDEFLGYVDKPETYPAWEHPNLLAKYAVTTGGVELARTLTPGAGGPASPGPAR
jgi:predicted dehydrogenase